MSPTDRDLARASLDQALDEEEAFEAELTPSVKQLVAARDVDGLLALAKAYRSGKDGLDRDLKMCFTCYDAAADLGSLVAEHAVALFYLTGGVVERDEQEGATRLRKAADGGYTPSKVYLANLYELGIFYKTDTQKADVWYRSAARSAGITDLPGTAEYSREMAELGCVRYCLEQIQAEEATDEDKAHFLQKAKAHGYREVKAQDERLSAMLVTGMEMADATAQAESESQGADPKQASKADPAAAKGKAAAKEAKAKPKGPPGWWSRAEWGNGMLAFFYALVFMAAALAGGHLLHEGALQMQASGQPVPVVGHRLWLIAPLLLGIVGILPSVVIYRIPTVARAILVGGVAAIAGDLTWSRPATMLLPVKATQILAFGAAGFLAGLLIFGIFGGVRSGRKKRVSGLR